MTAAPSVRFRQLVENALSHLTWFETVCGQLGLTGVSQVWDEEPAWYFWLGDRCYLLRYDGSETCSPELTSVLHAFPTREEWSCERAPASSHPLLTEEHFDFSTMTPRFESFALFKDVFIVGELTLFLNDRELRLLAASGYDQDWEKVWAFTEFLVAMLAFYRKAGPLEAPYQFSSQAGVTSGLVPFDSSGAALARQLVAADSSRRLPLPLSWLRLVHDPVRCTATGACACSLDH